MKVYARRLEKIKNKRTKEQKNLDVKSFVLTHYSNHYLFFAHGS
jgi:hypothetical protein